MAALCAGRRPCAGAVSPAGRRAPPTPLRPLPARRARLIVASLFRSGPEPANQGSTPLSLFHPFRNLPPVGSTMHASEEFCDPEEHICKTPSHTYEAACACCSGTGWSRGRAGRGGRGGRLGVCLACHGIGYVRHTTARFCPDSTQHLTLARDAPPPARRPLFAPRRRAAATGAPPAAPPPPPPPTQPRKQQQPGTGAAPKAAPRQQAAPTPRPQPQPQAAPAAGPRLRVAGP
ncbi:hypothetical protein Rsub_00753 [Raphidocelis subcapitata]|uniref:Uncharacterized protein n=1 Tax=Raphidocelis subcapitata TaxID=307507 RepID=A0A2V0NL00_9CHLO|nr:hypothetical protein Rsub_00753 [Raphidocelis subcapitata]|eukprot:GBF88041.1 hypothetical protein Rsub_00753 [Raphidocelis subcapitata]